MRLAKVLFALALACYGHDEEVRATGLVVTPSTAIVDTGRSVQLRATVSWSDGAEHPADVTFSPTSGTISATGFYQAGKTAGDFPVIATCDCGLVDTVVIRIAKPPRPRSFASLVISVSGLPSGVAAQVNVTGRGGYARATTASVTLDSMPLDDYVIRATGVATDAGNYSPAPDSQSTGLAAGENKSVQVTYTRAAPTGPSPHPRVWMTPARITFLKAQAAANTVRWQKVKASAEAQLKVGAGANAGTLPALCLAYLATGNATYAQRAGVILVASTDSAATTTLHGDSGYPYRGLSSVVSGLDWCYAGLTVAERQRTATWLMDAADWVWPESNSARQGAWGVADVTNNYYWGFMQTGPAALAAAGDDIGRGTISGTDRAAYHQALVLNHWNSAAVPLFASDLSGGASVEGTGYDISSNVALVAGAFQTAGISLTTPWLAQTIQWHIQSTMPGYQYFAPLGDQARVSDAPMYLYNRETMLGTLAAANAGSLLNAQAQRWLALIGQVPYQLENSLIANELLYYDPAAPVAGNLSGLPNGYYASGAGDFIYRQSWTDPNATAWVFHSGPSPDHMARDANDLMIWKGSFWVSAGANIYSQSGIEQATALFNYLTVGGAGQALYGANAGAILGTPSVSETLVVVRGQAKDTYGYPVAAYGGRTVTDATRTVVYLPQQDVFVIVDRATVVDASQQKVWHWHSKNPAVISGNTFRLSNPAGDHRCVGNVLLPIDAVLGSQTLTTAINGELNSNVVTVTLPVGNASDLVVTVLQCSTVVPASVTTSADAATVVVGALTVTVPFDATHAVTIR